MDKDLLYSTLGVNGRFGEEKEMIGFSFFGVFFYNHITPHSPSGMSVEPELTLSSR